MKATHTPTRQMLEAADNVTIPPFFWPKEWPAGVVKDFTDQGWSGLTRGEYDEKRFTLVYQAMIGAIE